MLGLESSGGKEPQTSTLQVSMPVFHQPKHLTQSTTKQRPKREGCGYTEAKELDSISLSMKQAMGDVSVVCLSGPGPVALITVMHG